VQPFIAVGMVEMPVRVDQMLNWIIAKTHQCLLHLRARDSGVDKHFAIAAGEHSYVPTRTVQNANVTAKLVDGDLRGSSGIADPDDGTFHYSYIHMLQVTYGMVSKPGDSFICQGS